MARPPWSAEARQMRKTIGFEKLRIIDMTSENPRLISSIMSAKCISHVVVVPPLRLVPLDDSEILMTK